MRKHYERTWPFENGGYLSGKQLFDILLLKRKADLEKRLNESRAELTAGELKKMYRSFLAESVLGLTEEEKAYLMKFNKEAERGFGILGSVIEWTGWDVRVGICCEEKGYSGVEVSADGRTYVKADFLMPGSPEETERMIRVAALKKCGREITLSEPEVAAEGFLAVRNRNGGWGMRIKCGKGEVIENCIFSGDRM